MKRSIVTAALLLIAHTANAATGFLSGETTSGMTKTCYYDVITQRTPL